MPTTDQPAARRRRGLLDPADLHASHLRSQGSTASLDRVRKWVLSILLVSTILHFSAGTAALAVFKDDLSSVGVTVLLVVSACVGVLAVAAGRLIHERSALTGWVLLGLLPALVGTWAVLA